MYRFIRWLFTDESKTVLGFFNADNLKNCPVISGEGETKSLYNMKPNGVFIIGSKDSVTGESPKGFMEQINLWTVHPEYKLCYGNQRCFAYFL